VVEDRLQAIIQRNSFAIMDGAMGTELERRGYQTTLPLWSGLANRDAGQLISEIHADYVSAGADIITTNTFRTTRYTLGKGQHADQFQDLTRQAVELAYLATEDAHRDILVAGSLAPLEDCYTPSLVPPLDQIHDAYNEQISLLHDCRVDFILIETMINMDEVMIACAVCRSLNIPFMLSFTIDNGCLLDGTPLDILIPTIAATEPLAMLLNCRPADEVTKGLNVLLACTESMVGAYGNGPGAPDPETGWQIEEGGVEAYAKAAKAWYEIGARVIGGCCGTTPTHIKAIAEMRDALRTR
jgi:homocysteine S-methyltransferase